MKNWNVISSGPLKRVEWVWRTMLLLRAVQTREERIGMLEAKWDKNIEYYHRFGFPETI